MKFTIPRGQEFYCEFVIKEPNSGTPMDLTGAIGLFNLSTSGLSSIEVIVDHPMTIVDAVNGLIAVRLSADQTADLIPKIGFGEDGFPLLSNYKSRLDIIASEPISVDIPKVYISDMGSVL